MNNDYANLSLTRSFQAIQGGEKYKVKKIDFDTTCPCQVTACDGGTIKFCAPVSFDPPLPHPPFDPCNYGQNVKADNFIAKTSYRLADYTSTCATSIGETRVLTYFADDTGTAGTPVLSAVLENNPITVGGAYLVINSPLDQPYLNGPSANNGMILYGGDISRTKNILIQALGSAGGNINMYANDNILLSAMTPATAATGKILGSAKNEINLNCSAGPMNLYAYENIGAISATGDINLTSTLKDINLVADVAVNITASEDDINLTATTKDINQVANVDVNITATTGDINLTSTAKDINQVANVDVNITATTGNIELSAVGTVNSEIVGYARDAVRWQGDIAPAITYPYATAFDWTQQGEIGHSGAGFWALPDEGQRVVTNAPLPGNSQTFPKPPTDGIKLWSCNFSPQEEQSAAPLNASFSHAGFKFVSAISDITGTAIGGIRNWTCTSSMLPDSGDLVIDAGAGTRPDPINAIYKSEIGSVAKPITKIEATTVNAVTSTVAGDIGCTNLTATGRILGTRVNIGMGYPTSGAPGLPPTHNYGSANDKAGDIAFQTFTNGIDMYCCFQDYADAPTPGVSRIWWASPRFNQDF